MRLLALHVLLLLSLLLQGVVAVGADFSHDPQQQHCSGHDSSENCACCPDGAAGSMNCTVQCSVSQAPIVMLALDRVVGHGTRIDFVSSAFPNPAYAPPVPPPIR